MQQVTLQVRGMSCQHRVTRLRAASNHRRRRSGGFAEEYGDGGI